MFDGDVMFTNIRKSDDIVLDEKMNNDIADVTNSIIEELIGGVKIKKADNTDISNTSFFLRKADAEKRLVFGWALVSADSNGQQIIDHQGDIVDDDELESGAYEYVLNFRDAGEEHIQSLRKKARMVESVVLTKEKLKAMGIPEGTVPYGWWIGFYVDDDETWEKIKNGTYKMFSIEGKAIREPVKEEVEKSEIVAKTFAELMKFNPYHDRLGRFTYAHGFMNSNYIGDRDKQARTFSANPNTRAGAMAIARESANRHETIGRAYGNSRPAPGNEQPKKPKNNKPKTEKPKTEKPKTEKPKTEATSNFKPAKSKKEATAYAQKELGFEKVSYGNKLDLDTINHINKQVADIQAKYPDTKGAVQELRTVSSNRIYAQISTDAFGTMSFQISSKTYGSGLDVLEKQYASDVKVGFHPKGTSAKDVVWHEYGHVIGGIKTKEMHGASATTRISSDKIFDFIADKKSGKWEKNVAKKAADSLGISTRDLANSISRYATQNSKELFAEAFAEFNGSKNPSPECIAIMKAAGLTK